ncbi:hypothetical protein [Actinomadura sp. HBU206391]|uniref:hypothetical protein n=1 Tax=Actinomadura sp. HBU206391 TaxID=2731692 RepID=UPI00165034D5|nr:hypothetical protein [Actinomadura sp. HBU206391]MBC6458502.1 hypothetical protein [Actinomadura sp. HBU206391]
MITRYATTMNLANRRFDRRRATLAETASALQMRSAQYTYYRANKWPIQPRRYTAPSGATPAFTGYPRWFFAALAFRGSGPVSRDVPVFVQKSAGAPWQAAYVPLAAGSTFALGKSIRVADVPDVVPPGDAGLVLPPDRLASSYADVLSRGTRSANARQFRLSGLLTARFRYVRTNREVLPKLNWKGYYRPRASAHPTYAVRTTSGGALVWCAVDFATAARNQGNRKITFTVASYGDQARAFLGKLLISKSYTGLEREEILAYVPPKGKGKIQILAQRWSPLALKGR